MAIKSLLAGYFWGVLIGAFFSVPDVKAGLIDPTKVDKDTIILNVAKPHQKDVQRPTLNEYKAYIKTIFGSQWRIAFAVSQSECNYSRKEWPACINSWAKERSLGAFQINIAQDNGHGRKVHWDKIPGETLKDKELWLADWKNNVLMAYRVYKESGWQAWTAYLNKSYKAHL